MEQYAEELLAAAGDLDAVYNGGDEVTSASIYQRSLAGMLAQFAGALEHESGYTEESFTAFRTAYQEAQSYYRQHGLVGTSVSASVLNGYQRHAAALWSAYYEGQVEPFAIEAGLVHTNMAYTPAEVARGKEIDFSVNRLQHMTMTDKLETVTQLFDRGMMNMDEGREVFQLPALDTPESRKYYIRRDYAEVNVLGNEPPAVEKTEVDDGAGLQGSGVSGHEPAPAAPSGGEAAGQ